MSSELERCGTARSCRSSRPESMHSRTAREHRHRVSASLLRWLARGTVGPRKLQTECRLTVLLVAFPWRHSERGLSAVTSADFYPHKT